MTALAAGQPFDAAYQGTRGAFSESAARELLAREGVPCGDTSQLLGCRWFDDLFDAVEQGKALYGVVPVENTLAGRVERCWELLASRRVDVVGETRLRISHALIGVPGTSITRIRRVRSHPVALAQCKRFFAAHPEMEPVPAFDTAGAVAEVLALGSPEDAAIASSRAAAVYGGTILAEELEDRTGNFTRFLLIARAADFRVASSPSLP